MGGWGELETKTGKKILNNEQNVEISVVNNHPKFLILLTYWHKGLAYAYAKVPFDAEQEGSRMDIFL